MTVLEFRVQNFRNIEDSGWIPLESVTALVGRNESGKTALLKALHKFNPASSEPFIAQKDFPRDRYTRDYRNGADWPACSVKVELHSILWDGSPAAEGSVVPRFATVTRYYDNSLDIELTPLPPEPFLSRDSLDQAFTDFRTAAGSLSAPAPEQEPAYQTAREDLLNWCDTCDDRVAEHTDMKSEAAISLLESLRNELNSKTRAETNSAVTPLQAVIKLVLRDARQPSVRSQLESVVEKHLPVFIYFDNYGILDSAVYLPRFVEDARRSKDSPQVRTINAMFKHVQLDAKDILDLGQSESESQRRQGHEPSPEQISRDQERKELRSIKLSSASNDITARFSNWWKQRRHRIRYEADGDFFRIWISDDRRPNVDIELESRSKGFQWFFSFYLVFLVESEDGHKEAVLLLDEPGLNLHPTAQEELISFFEELSQKNQLIYSTHSPWLIDGEHLERVRPVTETEGGHSHISVGEWPRDRETIFPLQGAAGYAMVRALFQDRQNILVEGMSDYFYLQTLSLLCKQAGKTGLPDDIYVTPCGGTKMVGHLSSLFLGQRVRPLVLLDGDEAGRIRRDALMKELYAGQEKAILMLDDVFGKAGYEIEDIIGDGPLLPVLNTILSSPLTLTEADKTKGSFPDQVKAAAARLQVSLPDGWKAEIARRLASSWATTPVTQIPADILDRGSTLFHEIIQRFSMFDLKVDN